MKVNKNIFSAIVMSFMLPVLSSADNLEGVPVEPVVPPPQPDVPKQVPNYTIIGPNEVLLGSINSFTLLYRTLTVNSNGGILSMVTNAPPSASQCGWEIPDGFSPSSVQNAVSIELTSPESPTHTRSYLKVAIGNTTVSHWIDVIGTDIDVDSNYDGIIDDSDDYTEDDTQGGLVFVDRYTRVDLKNNIPSDAGGLVTLEFWGAGKASAFRPDNTPIDSISWNPGGSPTYIYIRGDQVSTSQGDVVLTYEYIRNGVVLASDIIKLTVVDIDTSNIYPNLLELGESTCISYEISAPSDFRFGSEYTTMFGVPGFRFKSVDMKVYAENGSYVGSKNLEPGVGEYNIDWDGTINGKYLDPEGGPYTVRIAASFEGAIYYDCGVVTTKLEDIDFEEVSFSKQVSSTITADGNNVEFSADFNGEWEVEDLNPNCLDLNQVDGWIIVNDSTTYPVDISVIDNCVVANGTISSFSLPLSAFLSDGIKVDIYVSVYGQECLLKTITLDKSLDIGFVDEIPDYSLDENNDSDNFFLREYDGESNPDHEDLDIFYKVVVPEGIQVSDVKLRIFQGDSTTLEDTLQGEKDANDHFKTGTDLHVTWTPDISLADNHPGFYRVQLAVYVAGRTTPLYVTPIDDADDTVPGWQCPQDGLAIHDLVWKHRPIVYMGTGEIVGPPQDPFNSIVRPWMRHKNGVDKLNPNSDTSAITPPPTYNDFGSLTSADTENVLLRSNNTINPYFDIHDGHLQATGADGVLWHYSPLDADVSLKHDNYAFIQFWMYEPSSHGVYNMYLTKSNELAHEGDWEMCQFTIRLSNPDEPVTKKYWIEPFAATASQHYYGQTLLWNRNHNGPGIIDQSYVLHENNGDRVVIFIAENSHATYFRGGIFDSDIVFARCGTQIQYNNLLWNGYDCVIPQNLPVNMDICCLSDSNIQDWIGEWGQAKMIDFWSVGVRRMPGPPSPASRAANLDGGGKILIMKDPEAFHDSCRKTELEEEMELR